MKAWYRAAEALLGYFLMFPTTSLLCPWLTEPQQANPTLSREFRVGVGRGGGYLRAVVLKCWFIDWLYEEHLGSFYKAKFLGSIHKNPFRNPMWA